MISVTINSYFCNIKLFASNLLKEKRTKFLVLLALGVLTKVILLIAFVVVIKAVVLVYTGQFVSVVASTLSQLGYFKVLLEFPDSYYVVSMGLVAFFLFFLAGWSGYLYINLMNRYAYDSALKLRRPFQSEFLVQHKTIDVKDRRKDMRDFVFTRNQSRTRKLKLAVFHFLEAMQNCLVVFLCMLMLAALSFELALALIIISAVAVPAYLFVSYRSYRVQDCEEKSLRELVQQKRSNILDMPGARELELDFVARFVDTLNLPEDRELDYLSKRGERENRKVMFGLNFLLGIMCFVGFYMLSKNGVQPIERLSEIVIALFVIRFMFGVLQNLLVSIRQLNEQYDVIKQLNEITAT